MSAFIRPGDAYCLPVTLHRDGAAVTSTAGLTAVEFTLGTLNKLWKADGTGPVQFSQGKFMFPLSQAESFAMAGKDILTLDVRAKFTDGQVVGAKLSPRVYIRDSLSKEVL